MCRYAVPAFAADSCLRFVVLARNNCCMYFETYARVRVRAPELGWMYNILCLISLLSILYSIFMSHQHLEMEPISFGVASFRLRNHDDDHAAVAARVEHERSYCAGQNLCQVRACVRSQPSPLHLSLFTRAVG